MNPDFGQVEADPAEVNLSAFETFFDERRPFFLEGSQLLTGSVNNYFYSRRIGAPPPGRASGDFVDHPSTTTILGAAKLTGRLASGTSVGLLGAVTDAESARRSASPQPVRHASAWRRARPTASRALQQEFGAGGSTVGAHDDGGSSRARRRRSARGAADAQRVHHQRRLAAALQRTASTSCARRRRRVRRRRCGGDRSAAAVERAVPPAARRRLRLVRSARARR